MSEEAAMLEATIRVTLWAEGLIPLASQAGYRMTQGGGEPPRES